MDITALPEEVPGFEVNLENVAVWVIREMHLHGSLPDDITFKLSIDGRPYHGKGTRVLYTSPCFFSYIHFSCFKEICHKAISIFVGQFLLFFLCF